MIRETLNPGAVDAYVYFYPNQTYLYDRLSTNGSMTYQAGGNLVASVLRIG